MAAGTAERHGGEDGRRSRYGAGVPTRWLVAPLALAFAVDQLLLLRFLGRTSPFVWMAGGIVAILLAAMIARPARGAVPVGRLAACLAIAGAVLLLGGEGRVFYANVDWQVRDAVLADMIRAPWPFLYGGGGGGAAGATLLRAPIGMYLLPALAGKAWGPAAADLALLVQNAILLAMLLALGSLLFATPRARRIAALVIVAFSGMDLIGALIVRPDLLWPPDIHIEGVLGLQYSAMLTLAFWVPQHAIAGWTGGLFFLLWRGGIVPLRTLLAIVPLAALWSPLGVMGTLPFAALATGSTIAAGRLRRGDVLLPAAASAASIPALAYMGAGAGAVGAHVAVPQPAVWLLFECLEVVPIIACVAALGGVRHVGRGAFAIVAACLLAMPWLTIGSNVDFVMRASVPALLILAVAAAGAIADPADGQSPDRARWRMMLIAILVIGAATPVREIVRATIYRAAPHGRCDVRAAWRESFASFRDDTYFAAPAALPAALRPRAATIVPPTRGACYDRPWKMPRFAFVPQPARRIGVID